MVRSINDTHIAFHFDSYDQSIVVDSFDQGIADSPFAGISDMRNVNITSVPGEASVNFSTATISPATVASGTVVSANGSTHYVTYTGAAGLVNGAAVTFTGGSLPTGLTANQVYWVSSIDGAGAGTFQVFSDINTSSLVSISGTGTGTFAVSNMSQPKYFAYDSGNSTYWLVDSAGLVWTNASSGTGAWRYTGNLPNSVSHGNGLLYYQASDGTGYIFVFSNSSIDYTLSANSSISWSYQWRPSAGTVGSWSNTPSAVLNQKTGNSANHEAFVAPDNHAYFCDGNWVDVFFQADVTTPVPFVPTTKSTYTFSQYQLLPSNDLALCLTFLNSSVLVGGQKNIVYVWDRISPLPNTYILFPENSIQKMVTVNTNTFAFVGSRGRIYITNGTNAQLYKKIPDHISGTVEPYFTWGGAAFTKNQLYFGVSATDNAGNPIAQYGGVWAIDMDTDALRLTNQLSYGTYAGLATAVTSNQSGNPAGAGLYVGWQSGTGFGIDTTVSAPYTGSQASIDSDLIPIGTFRKPRQFTRIEYRLTRPLVSGESISIYYRLVFNAESTGYTLLFADSTVGNYSSDAPVNFRNAQWVQFQIVMNSTVSSPSYVRVKEIRVTGLTGPTLAQSQNLNL